jgi:hypothetical protein
LRITRFVRIRPRTSTGSPARRRDMKRDAPLVGAHAQTKAASVSGEHPGERPGSRSISTHR